MAWRIKTLSIFTFEWIFLFNYFAFYITSIYTRKFFAVCLRSRQVHLYASRMKKYDGAATFWWPRNKILPHTNFHSRCWWVSFCTKNRVVIFISVNVCRTITMKSRIPFSLHISSGFSRCVLTMAICIRRDFFFVARGFSSIAWLDFLRGGRKTLNPSVEGIVLNWNKNAR